MLRNDILSNLENKKKATYECFQKQIYDEAEILY